MVQPKPARARRESQVTPMAVVSIFSAAFCSGREVAGAVAKALGCPLVDDALLLSRLAWRPRDPEAPAAAALLADPESFAAFPQERDRLLAELRLGVADLLSQDHLVYLGLGAQLMPPAVSHALSVCLVAGQPRRLELARREAGLDPAAARERLAREDLRARRWVDLLHGRDPWSSDLYDLLLDMDEQDPGQTVGLILEHARSALLAPTADSRAAVRDFRLTARLQAVLADQTDRGQQDLPLAAGLELGGMIRQVARVEVEQAEREALSAQALAGRLGAVLARDGQEALRLAGSAEAIVLETPLPGADGLETLRRLQGRRPDLEVVIVTASPAAPGTGGCGGRGGLGPLVLLARRADLPELLEGIGAGLAADSVHSVHPAGARP